MAQAQLRGVLGYLDVPTMGQPEVYIHFTDGMIDDDGNVANEKTRVENVYDSICAVDQHIPLKCLIRD